jgi:cell wall-associated NlpC family hydrolase
VFVATRPAAGDAISNAKAKAAQIQAQLLAAQNRQSVLSQQFDAARYKLDVINGNIAKTEAAILADQHQVTTDRNTLSKAAINSYVNAGSSAAQNPLFSNSQTAGAADEYSKIALGDIDLAVANLHTAENSLAAERVQLASQHDQAQGALNAEQAAINANDAAVAQENAALAQENGQIKALIAQQQAEAAAAQLRAAQARLAAAATSTSRAVAAGLSVAAPPPTAPGGAGAVQAAESQIGVPYRWGAESPKGSADPGFDCSGLTAWAWGQVGVGLSHFSGAQMAESAPVPLSDLQPGDLLFYGPGGGDHVAMYIGGGQMIEAPYTGANVRIVGARFGGGFAGAGRP